MDRGQAQPIECNELGRGKLESVAGPASPRPAGGQHPDAVASKPAEGEREGRGRCLVEPLGVVDGEQKWGPARQFAEDAAKSRCRGSRLGRRALVGGAKERDLKRMALRFGQRVERLRGHRLEQVSQRGERELRLGLRRSANQRPVAARLGSANRLPPQGRLADPGLPLELEGHEPVLRRVEKALDRRELALPADDLPDALRSFHRPGPAEAVRLPFSRDEHIWRALRVLLVSPGGA